MAGAVAVFAAIVAGVGLWAAVAAEGRCWGPEVAGISQGGRWLLILLLVSPHTVALVAAVARRILVGSTLVLLGAAVNAWLSIAAWSNDHLNRTERVLGLFQTWAVQVLVCGVVIAGGVVAWQERRRRPDSRA
jgi:hypothetical protein